MRVICIDNSKPLQPQRLFADDWIYEGEVYTVLHEIQKPKGLFYILAERFINGRVVLYLANRFVPLSENDEIGFQMVTISEKIASTVQPPLKFV